MTSAPIIHAPASRADLTQALNGCAPHLRPVIEAVRDCQVGMLFVQPSADPFRIPKDPRRPAIVIIGDDFDQALGPAGFHMPSIRRAMRSCCAFTVVSCAPLTSVYAETALATVLRRRNTMLIETRPEQEISWLCLIQEMAPGGPIRLATVEGGWA